MVAVFKTNVHEAYMANLLVKVLLKHFPGCEINFDLDDCDKILRVQHTGITLCQVIAIINKHGFLCEELLD